MIVTRNKNTCVAPKRPVILIPQSREKNLRSLSTLLALMGMLVAAPFTGQGQSQGSATRQTQSQPSEVNRA